LEIDQLCTGHSGNWEQYKEQEIWLAAMVATKTQKRTKTDKIFITVQLEDLQGSVELALFGADVAKYGPWFEAGNALLLRCRVGLRFGSQDQYELKPVRVLLLQDARQELFKGLKLEVEMAQLARLPRTALAETLKKHAGNASVYVQLYDSVKGIALQTLARSQRVELSNELLKELSDLGFDRYKLVKN